MTEDHQSKASMAQQLREWSQELSTFVYHTRAADHDIVSLCANPRKIAETLVGIIAGMEQVANDYEAEIAKTQESCPGCQADADVARTLGLNGTTRAGQEFSIWTEGETDDLDVAGYWVRVYLDENDFGLTWSYNTAEERDAMVDELKAIMPTIQGHFPEEQAELRRKLGVEEDPLT